MVRTSSEAGCEWDAGGGQPCLTGDETFDGELRRHSGTGYHVKTTPPHSVPR